MTTPADDRKPRFQFSLGMFMIAMFFMAIVVGSVVMAYNYSLAAGAAYQERFEAQKKQTELQMQLYSEQFKVTVLKQENEMLKLTNKTLLEANERVEKKLQALKPKQSPQ